MSPDRAWRDAVQPCCDRCRAPLRLLEGPLCDECVDASEVVPTGGDKYLVFRRRQQSVDEVLDEDPRPSTGRDRLAVDLRTGEILLCRYPSPRAA